jgi:hypothetical protein
MTVAEEEAQWPGKRRQNSDADFMSVTYVARHTKKLLTVKRSPKNVSATGTATNGMVEKCKANIDECQLG